MYGFLLLLAVLVFSMLKYRETFVVKYGNPLNDEDLVSFDSNAKGTRLVGAFGTDACPANKSDAMDGLCYEACEIDYHGVGVRCYADTVNIGIGKVMELRSCADSGYAGWSDTGLLCNEPIQCGKGWEFFTKGCWGGNVRPKKLTCDGYGDREEAEGFCYKPCPKEKPKRVPLFPYLCFNDRRGLSYDRGAGDVPPLFAFGE